MLQNWCAVFVDICKCTQEITKDLSKNCGYGIYLKMGRLKVHYCLSLPLVVSGRVRVSNNNQYEPVCFICSQGEGRLC